MVRMNPSNCRTALGQAVREDLIRISQMVGCKLPPMRRREMQVLSHQELQRFLIPAKVESYFALFFRTYLRAFAVKTAGTSVGWPRSGRCLCPNRSMR